MKDSNQVIDEFNDVVNMTSSDLEKWLKSGDSRSAGWPKEDESGESVGHDSGRKIVEILKANPQKKPEKYTEDQIGHMRKVVSYCNRHLAQEAKGNGEKSPEDLKKTKSYASLKNWGHDSLKDRDEAEDDGGQPDDEEDAPQEEDDANDEKMEEQDDEEEEYDDGGGEEDEEEDDDEADDEDKENPKVGAKRKKVPNGPSGANKKRETAKGKTTSNVKTRSSDKTGDDGEAQDDDEYKEDDDEDVEDDEDGDDGEDDQGGQAEEGNQEKKKSGKTAKKGPEPGDTVSWNWGNGQPEGKVLDVKEEKTTITTKKGNKVSRNGDPEDPAVVLDTGKSKAIKSNHELN